MAHKPTIDDGDYNKTDVKEELRNPMGILSHETKLDDLTTIDTDDEKNAQAPDAAQRIHNLNREGGHALLKPPIYVVVGDMVVTWVKGNTDVYIHTFSVLAAAATDYVKFIAMEKNKMSLYSELPRHQALSPSSCPEDSMGG